MRDVGKNCTGRHLLTALCLSGVVGLSMQVGAQVAVRPDARVQPADEVTAPSQLDYVVLASFADASSLLSLSAYRAPDGATVEEHKKAYVSADLEEGK